MQSFACIIVVSAQTCQWSEWPSSPQNVVLCPTQHAGVGCASSCPERLLLDRSQVSVLIIDAQEMASPWNTTLEDVVHSVRRRHVSRVTVTLAYHIGRSARRLDHAALMLYPTIFGVGHMHRTARWASHASHVRCSRAWCLLNLAVVGPSFTEFQTKSSQFAVAAKASQSDKFGGQAYQHLYGQWLPSRQQQPVSLLEIGVGCMMPYGPGKSAHLWLSYFAQPRVIAILDLFRGKNCSAEWRARTASWASLQERVSRNLYSIVGSQSDPNVLKRVTALGPFDFIIDDAAHLTPLINASLAFLFPAALTPGGVYVVEDLQSARESDDAKRAPGGRAAADDESNGEQGSSPIMRLVTQMLERLLSDVAVVECTKSICAFARGS